MSEPFKESLPLELVTHVVAGCGRKGEDWLKSVPDIIAALEDRWSLKVLTPFPDTEFNFVAPAVLENSEPAVVKIAPPWETVEIFGEAAWLKCRNGNAAIRLLAEDRDTHSILVERAFPGKNLSECFKGREPESVAPAIEVLRATVRPATNAPDDVILLDGWFDGMRRFGSKKFPATYAEKAFDIYERLSKQSGNTFYLHGDYHPANVVSAERVPFLAIDPKGIVGHIGYEIAVFLNNFHWWQEEKRDIRQILDVAVRQFADAFEIDAIELRQWAYAQMVLGAWWTFDEMHDLYDNQVVKADIWDV